MSTTRRRKQPDEPDVEEAPGQPFNWCICHQDTNDQMIACDNSEVR